jgi:hypothetical protein
VKARRTQAPGGHFTTYLDVYQPSLKMTEEAEVERVKTLFGAFEID